MLALALLLSSGCGRSPETAPTPAADTPSPARPADHLVLITLDTLRADHLGCYGSSTARTPHLDALAASGVRFELAMTVSNNTLPSHAAILTGRHPQDVGVPVSYTHLTLPTN